MDSNHTLKQYIKVNMTDKIIEKIKSILGRYLDETPDESTTVEEWLRVLNTSSNVSLLGHKKYIHEMCSTLVLGMVLQSDELRVIKNFLVLIEMSELMNKHGVSVAQTGNRLSWFIGSDLIGTESGVHSNAKSVLNFI